MAWNIEDLPKVVSSKRHMMLLLTDTETYEEDIKDSPFFSSDELRSIEEKYKEGITKTEIMKEVEKRLMIKWNTIKNYIQNDVVPRALRREKTPKGMISVYPPNFIRHLNFVRYCLFSHKQSLKPIMDILATLITDDHTLILAKSQDFGSGISGDDCFHEFWCGNMRIENGIGWIDKSIKAAEIVEERKQPYLKRLATIEKISDQLASEMKKFEDELKSNESNMLDSPVSDSGENAFS
ncbi:MAG TPA: hypothetical protein PK250_07680 [Syntrophobacter fumaroxidans]|nr:hypothetical protein [Syntrophobacter fumaroxidans]